MDVVGAAGVVMSGGAVWQAKGDGLGLLLYITPFFAEKPCLSQACRLAQQAAGGWWKNILSARLTASTALTRPLKSALSMALWTLVYYNAVRQPSKGRRKQISGEESIRLARSGESENKQRINDGAIACSACWYLAAVRNACIL